MICDGYPQDHDYGADRTQRIWSNGYHEGIGGSTPAGVLTYRLTVDPSGHDYLREMCPEGHTVIQTEQLPEELLEFTEA